MTPLTRLGPAYFSHALGSPFNVDVSAVLAKCPYYHASPAELRDKLEGLQDAKLERRLDLVSEMNRNHRSQNSRHVR